MDTNDPDQINANGAHVRLTQALGFGEAGSAADSVNFVGQVRQVATVWPFSFVVLLVAAAGMIASATLSQDSNMLWRVIAESTGMMLIGLSLLVALKVPPMSRWLPQRHIGIAILCGIGIGIGLMGLLIEASHLPADRNQLACSVVIVGAMAMTAMALHAIRAALFSFAMAIVIMVLVMTGPTIGAGMGFGCLLCLGIAMRRLAYYDVAEARRIISGNGDGVLAARFVREFETQGTGWFWQTDRDGILTYLSPKVAKEVAEHGLPPIGRALSALFQVDSSASGTERTLNFHLSSRTGFADYPVRQVKLGRIDDRWSISGRPVIDATGCFQGFIGSGTDLTDKRRSEAEIIRLALFDALTGLANRQRMRASLDQTLNQSTGPYRPTALFLLDLDRFKVVNDTLGHQAGDALLKQVAQRLLHSVGDAGLVGRPGGDEFQVVLPGEANVERLSELARTIISSLSQPYFIDDTSVTIGCSIGVAIAAIERADSETLIRNADLALYAAKADGRGVHRFYSEDLLQGAENRKQLEDDLRQALLLNQLYLVYQPVVCAQTTRIVGYEALLRWDHPIRGNISPADFVQVAEECGLIESIGVWALRTACLDAAMWPKHLRVAVNVSRIQFANPALPSIVTNAIAQAGIAADRLELEITQGVFLGDKSSTDQMFKSLKGIGVRLALDDFGTGHSSLGYLQRAPFDKIKIDHSFFRGAAISDSRNAAIISAIVSLAKTLKMETTAVGVETVDEIVLVQGLGCTHIQGFVYGQPARAEGVLKALEANGQVMPSAQQSKRAPRTSVTRSARLEVEDAHGEVRIRNISSKGAMIEGIRFPDNAANLDLLIELIEGQMFSAKVKWSKNGQVGLEFAESFDMERLPTAEDPQSMRRFG